MKSYNYLPILAIILLLLLPTNAFSGLFGPSNMWECILEEMPEVKNDVSAKQVMIACRKKFPDDSTVYKKNPMIGIKSADECILKYVKEVENELAARYIVRACYKLYQTSGEKKASSSDSGKLTTINNLLSQGYEMSENQRQTINQLVAEGKELTAQGKQEEADKVFDQAIELLEVIAETDRFNKSE